MPGRSAATDSPLPPCGGARAACGAVRGKRRSRVGKSHPSPFPPCDLRATPQDRGGKPSPTRGEGESVPGTDGGIER
jgi:hypothetical protein